MDIEHNGTSTDHTDHEGRSLISGQVSGGKARQNDQYVFHFETPRIVVWFAAAAILGFLILHLNSPPEMLSHYNSFSMATGSGGTANQSPTPIVKPLVAPTIVEEKSNDLATILKNAANGDKTVILTTLNKPWAEPNQVFDVFLESFRIGDNTQKLLSHLVVITLDEYAHTRCKQIHTHCYAFDTNGTDFSGIAHYGKPDYLDMMWRRLGILLSVLELGYSFIFSDTDIVWFRDSFPRFHAEGDFQIACDHFGGDPSDMKNSPNAGLQYARSNKRSIEFFKYWIAARARFPGKNEQNVLNFIKTDPFINQMGLQFRLLDTQYYGGFCEISRDLNKVCTMHANCCVGLSNKVYDLNVMLGDWRKYLAWLKDPSLPEDNFFKIPQHCVNSKDD